MKGMGRYQAVEMELNHLSIDELNELYLTGELDEVYDHFDRTGEVKVVNRKSRSNSRKKRGE